MKKKVKKIPKYAEGTVPFYKNTDFYSQIGDCAIQQFDNVQQSKEGVTTGGVAKGTLTGAATGAAIAVSFMASVAKGAKLGGTLGSVFGPWGTALGAVGGALAGAIITKLTGTLVSTGSSLVGSSYTNSKQFSFEEEMYYQSLFKDYDKIIVALGVNENKKYASSIDKENYNNRIEKYEKYKEYQYDNSYDVVYDRESNSFTPTASGGYADDFKKEIEAATNKFIDVQTEAYKKAVRQRITEFTKEFLPSILGQSETFGVLSDTLQSFVNNVAQGLNTAQFSNADE